MQEEEQLQLRSFELLADCGQPEEACQLHNAIQETMANLIPELGLSEAAILAVVAATVETLVLNVEQNAIEQGFEWDALEGRMEAIGAMAHVLLSGFAVKIQVDARQGRARGNGAERLQ
jgi:folylpolyglutamate synthase/dihydropteroate synthase